MDILKALFTITLTQLLAHSLATQKLAALCGYDSLLGKPLFLYGGTPFYEPWCWLSWRLRFGSYIPALFARTEIYLYAGLLISFLILYFLRPKKPLDSHGSAKWADAEEISEMPFLSAHGVVIGLYDSSLKKAATRLLRKLEVIKKRVVADAEKAYDKRSNRKRDKLFLARQELENRLLLLEARSGTAALKEADEEAQALTDKLKAIDKALETMPKYSSKMNPFTVYPLEFLYNRYLKFYRGLEHNYLHDDTDRHIMVIAPTRSGKGVGLIVPTLLGEWTSSVVVNDIKSENWGITSGWRKRMGHKVIKFDPTAGDGSTARWNPLDEVMIGTQNEVAQSQIIASLIADYEGKGKPDHWIANATTVIQASILHLKYAHYADPENYPTEPNFNTIVSFLKTNIIKVKRYTEHGRPAIGEDGLDVFDTKELGFIESLKELKHFQHVPDEGIKISKWDDAKGRYVETLFTPKDLKENYPFETSLDIYPNIHPIVYKCFIEIAAKPESEGGSIISTANTALKEFLDPRLAENTAVSDFAIHDLLNYEKPVSLYLVTPPSDLLRLSPVFRLFFELMVSRHTKKIGDYVKGQAAKSYKHKCLLLMDEFAALGNMQNFAGTLSYIAGYGLKTFLIIQGVPQIQGIYGKDNPIIMNCHTKIYYAPNDMDTAKYIESNLGVRTIEIENRSRSDSFFKGDSYSYSATSKNLSSADEIKKLGNREIIDATDYSPILTEKVKYYENKYFLDRLVDAPVVSDLIRNNPYPRRDKAIAAWKEKKRQELLGKDSGAGRQAELNYEEIHNEAEFKYKPFNQS